MRDTIKAILSACVALLTLTASAQDVKLSGTPIGSQGYDYGTGQAANTLANAFDGNLATAYASYDRSKTWVGLDLGEPHVITRVGWSPRNDGLGPGRMVLALFEGSNRPDFMDAVPLYLIDQAGTIGTVDHADVNVSLGFRYVRYIGPNNARCNVAEVEFYGHQGEGDSTQFYQVTNLPTVTIHTENNIDPMDKVTEHISHVNIIYENGTLLQSRTATARCRGNASFNFEKKPYRIKFDEKLRVLAHSGDAAPAKAKKWTLINNWGDKTLMRNIVAFEVSRRMGMPYTPYCKPVDVILNGEYKGCYQLSDQITIDKDRVAIKEMEPTDNEEPNISGGYLIEVDGYANQEKSWFTSSRGIPVTIKSPDEDDITAKQHEYIKNCFDEMERRLHSSYYTDPATGYRSVLDVESFMKYFLQEQIVANPDVFWSTYMYKGREDNQLHVGPCWDFDNAFNNDKRSYDMNDKTDFNMGGAPNMDGFTRRILSDPYVARTLRTRWRYYRDSADVNLESLLAYVDSTAQLLDHSQRLNFMRWDILGKQVHENPIEGVTGEYYSTVEFLKTFLRGRFPWMDRMLGYEDGDEDTTFEISTAQELEQFAKAVNGGKAWINAILKADIDYSAYQTMIGEGVAFRGCFDGAGHTVRINLRRYAENAGLFYFMNGEVKNLHVAGTINTSNKYAGGIAAQSAGLIHECVSTVNIQSTVNGDGTHGGIMGISNGATVSNCVFAGSISGGNTTCCGGFVGWASSPVYISNSLMIGNISVQTSGSNIFSRNGDYATIVNSYYQTDWRAPNNNGQSYATTDQKVRNGEVCYALNNGVTDGTQAWYQTLGEDEYPVPDATHGTVMSDGTNFFNQGARYSLLDGTTYAENVGQQVKEFIYHRNFQDKLQPIYLPVCARAEDFSSLGLTVYDITAVQAFDRDGDGTRELSYIEVEPITNGTLKAHYPYIVRAEESGYCDLTVSDTYLYPAEETTTTLRGEHCDIDFVGTYSRIFSSALRAKGAYVITDDSLQPVASSILHLCRWYALVHMTDGNEPLPELPIVVKGEEEVLGVLELQPDADTQQPIYDLSGRRITAGQRGIQIVNGKRVLVK